MKVIPLSKARARLSYYGRLCQREQVVVTVNGLPSFQMVPLEEDDDLIDRLLASNAKFREYGETCLRARTLSTAEAARRLGLSSTGKARSKTSKRNHHPRPSQPDDKMTR